MPKSSSGVRRLQQSRGPGVVPVDTLRLKNDISINRSKAQKAARMGDDEETEKRTVKYQAQQDTLELARKGKIPSKKLTLVEKLFGSSKTSEK